MNAETLLHAIEQVDERYIQEAGEARRSPSPERTALTLLRPGSAPGEEPTQLRARKPRPLWHAVAAACTLLIVLGSGVFLLRSLRSPLSPIPAGPAASPSDESARESAEPSQDDTASPSDESTRESAEPSQEDAASPWNLNEVWLTSPAADPIQVVREAISRQIERDYTRSVSLGELRLDETEKQKVRARDLNCEGALRNGFGAEFTAFAEKDPDSTAVVYAQYHVEYDHTKIWYPDGFLDQYFYLVRRDDGLWEIFYNSSAKEIDARFPIGMSMEALQEKLGFAYSLPDAGAYSGTIVSKFDDSLGEDGGILLEYSFDGFVVYAMKYRDSGADAYDAWETDYTERGSETVRGVEVRFRGHPLVPEDRGVAFWKQDGYQYILNCETAPGADIMNILPLFLERESGTDGANP